MISSMTTDGARPRNRVPGGSGPASTGPADTGLFDAVSRLRATLRGSVLAPSPALTALRAGARDRDLEIGE